MAKKKPDLFLAPSPRAELKLDLACGRNKVEGYTGVDIAKVEGVDIVLDLWKFPWPWGSDTVTAIHCSHFIEHLPAREVEERDLTPGSWPMQRASIDAKGNAVSVPLQKSDYLGKDFLAAFMDECWRILKKTTDINKPAGTMKIAVPSARHHRAFQDPTHRRYLVPETFGYFNRDWRAAQKLEHYRISSHFASNVGHSMPAEIAQLHPLAQERVLRVEWNCVYDYVADLIAVY